MKDATRPNKPLSNAQLIENHVANMRYRDAIATFQGIRLDIAIMQCELAVEKVFARHNYEALA